MSIKDLQNKRIALLGLGVENLAMLRFLLTKKVECEFVICDARSRQELGERFDEFDEIMRVSWKLGQEFNKNLGEFDILFRSPGWPILCPGIQEALQQETILYSPMNLFFDLCPTKKIIGITGTKGKGTTSSLIYEIIKKSEQTVFLGGNIGVAPFDFLASIKKTDFVVLELSSFQLEDLQNSPKISVITNFSPEHLFPADPKNPNYHQSLDLYWQAKKNIFSHNQKGNSLVVNVKLKEKFIDENIESKMIYFNKSSLESKLVGEHNKENIAAAVAVAKILKIDKSIINSAVSEFKGLPFRIEFIKKKRGVLYYNDTFATTPEAAVTALNSFSAPIVLLAGGADKGADFLEFAKKIKECVKFLILFQGKGSERIMTELKKVDYDLDKVLLVDNMAEAVKEAKEKSLSGDIVLLSTGCASFGVFKNYKERGRLFNEEVDNL